MTIVKDIHFHGVVRPLRVTFATAKGQKNVMQSVIVRVILADGISGLGECPTSLSLSSETIPVIKTILNEVRHSIKEMPIDQYDSVIGQLRKRYPQYPMTISGLEIALFRANLASKGITEHTHWGGKIRTVQTDITLPFVQDKSFLLRWIKYAFRKGFTVYKLKVSGDVGQDRELISFVYKTLRDNLDDFRLRLDGNQGYNKRSFQQITDYIQKEGYRIELFEQPLPKDDYKGLKAIKKSSPFPIILDETVLTGLDAQRVIEEDLAHGINIKMAKSGIAESASILAIAKKQGLKLMIGCMTETMIGLSAALNFAAGTGAFDYIDLDAIFLLHHKNQYNDITLEGPCFILES
jgi:L-alanine-DL-glutamate epimerase-like enolase superfamily enzyme